MINGKIKGKNKVGKEFDPMDIDYRKRAIAIMPEMSLEGWHMPAHEKLFYGVNADDIFGLVPQVYDLDSPYAELSIGGRKPGKRTVELIDGRQKFFFTKHLGRDDLQGGGDVDSIRARYAPRSIGGATETQAHEGGVGSDSGVTNEGETK